MKELTCTEVQDAAAEYSLGILPAGERGPVAAHLIRCRDCRAEIEDLARIGDELLEVIPDAEPPVGFDRKVLAVTQPRKRRPARMWIGAGAAALAATAAAVTGVVVAGGGSERPAEVTATLVSDGRVIGAVYTEGRPPWISMRVDHAAVSGPVTCELVEQGGRVVRLGSFDLVDGSGSWSAPEPAIDHAVVGARLISANGRVLASAGFKA